MLFCCLSVWFFLLGGCSLISWPKPCTNSPPSPQLYIWHGGEFRIGARVSRAWTFASYCLDLSRAHDCEPGPARCWAQYALDAHSYLCLHVCKSCGHLEISHFALPLALPSLTHTHHPPHLRRVIWRTWTKHFIRTHIPWYRYTTAPDPSLRWQFSTLRAHSPSPSHSPSH